MLEVVFDESGVFFRIRVQERPPALTILENGLLHI